jgi:hypothetical protein
MSNEVYKFLTEFINSSQYVECAKAAHEAWLDIKTKQGWTYGPERDDDKKYNPWMMPFEELPEDKRGLNSLGPYAVANFFRNKADSKTLPELKGIFQDVLDGKLEDLLEELSEYVHSHFLINLISKGETTRTRKDMVVFQDLDADTKSWDTYIALEVIKYLSEEIDKSL